MKKGKKQQQKPQGIAENTSRTLTAGDIELYIKNATDKVEVAIHEGNYYEDYVVEHAKNYHQETKILAQLTTHFRGLGFRVKLYDSHSSEYEGKNFNFLRIAWSYNPYHYPEEKNSTIASFFSFLPFSRKASRPNLFDNGLEAYRKVKESDRTTAETIRILEDAVEKAVVTQQRKVVIKRHELKGMLQEIHPHDALRKIDTREIIRHFERKGYRVIVQRMFQFEFLV